jgi:ABC-2 type transport system permease protein
MSATIDSTAGAPRSRLGRAYGFRQLLQTELKLFVREPMLLFWGLVFPVGLLVVLGVAGPKKPQHALGGVKFIVVYTPVVMMLMLTVLSLSALPAALAAYRDKGYLRRLSTTPVGALRLLAAQIVIDFALEAVAVVLILLVARLAFSVPLPQQVGGFLLAILLTMAAMLAFGVLIAAIAPTQRVAAGIGSLLLFPLMFFAGLWVPQSEMGAGLRDVSHYTPLGAAVPAVQNAISGHWPGSVHLLVLAGYAVVLCTLAVRFFRWDR